MDIIKKYNEVVLDVLNKKYLKYDKRILETGTMERDIKNDFQKLMKDFNEKYFMNKLKLSEMSFCYFGNNTYMIIGGVMISKDSFEKYLTEKYELISIKNKIERI